MSCAPSSINQSPGFLPKPELADWRELKRESAPQDEISELLKFRETHLDADTIPVAEVADIPSAT